MPFTIILAKLPILIHTNSGSAAQVTSVNNQPMYNAELRCSGIMTGQCKKLYIF
jgi:hypothetical protein